jgi:hypothetical protein
MMKGVDSMANVQTLQEKVAKAQAKVEKCKGTIERHKKALEKKQQTLLKKGIDVSNLENIQEIKDAHRQSESYWDICEVTCKLEDIKGATKKLEEAEQILVNWQVKLDKEMAKDEFISNSVPQVIKNFLEQWKQMAYQWHIRRYNAYQDFEKKLEQDEKDAIISFVESNPEEFSRYLENGKIKDFWAKDLINIHGKGLEKYLKENKLDYWSIQDRKAQFAGQTVLEMCRYRNEKERLEWLNKVLEEEKRAKMIDLINRITAVVGTIVDASNLRVSEKGNLDGIIIGDVAKAKIETIGAGGWNVQCFHYRTLVNKII